MAGILIGAHLEKLWVVLMAAGVLIPIPFFAYVRTLNGKKSDIARIAS
jgi:hypothetical protein